MEKRLRKPQKPEAMVSLNIEKNFYGKICTIMEHFMSRGCGFFKLTATSE